MSTRLYYVEESGKVFSMDLETGIRMATMRLAGGKQGLVWYGREVKKADPKSRLVFHPFCWTRPTEHWTEHLKFLQKLKTRKAGRPYKAPGEYKHQHTVRASDDDIHFLLKRGFSLQSFLDHAIELEKQITRK